MGASPECTIFAETFSLVSAFAPYRRKDELRGIALLGSRVNKGKKKGKKKGRRNDALTSLKPRSAG
jgi:hypothetical protein